MKQLIIDTIIKWCEGATDNIADGVRFKECANELSQLLNKHDVSGWQDFAVHPPKDGDEVILKNKMTGHKLIWKVTDKFINDDFMKDQWWMPSPA